MKRLLLIMCLIFILTGCGKIISNEQEVTVLNCKITEIDYRNLQGTYIVIDSDTGVNYLVVGHVNRLAITPLYDANGDVVIEKNNAIKE